MAGEGGTSKNDIESKPGDCRGEGYQEEDGWTERITFIFIEKQHLFALSARDPYHHMTKSFIYLRSYENGTYLCDFRVKTRYSSGNTDPYPPRRESA